jgi:hypothetical protein
MCHFATGNSPVLKSPERRDNSNKENKHTHSERKSENLNKRDPTVSGGTSLSFIHLLHRLPDPHVRMAESRTAEVVT